ncbi:serine/threonine-protein kinase WAG1 [Zea mays]|uniref:non-specific serine/threonine protein kinase n=1 Tax=Zea mays TaxID=4577 RepID=A0A1D6JWA6_MAIZE|nr:serine/threonine-protein kinase WAG1 [Zea mays]ONL96049.1 Serine/threonine-protein kinase WAG2 [Zea mays]|eukprot:XP_008653608.1 serine/threonine-protein kinase WAG1 [Zea mays]
MHMELAPPPMGDVAHHHVHDPASFSPLSSDAGLSPHFPPALADGGAGALDLSFTSTASASTSSFTTATTFSARSSLSLPSFSSSTSLSPRPHSSSASPHWAHLAAARAATPDGVLRLAHLHLVRELGHGHLARVFLCRLKSSPPASPLFALKVVDLRDDDPSRVSHVLAESRVLSCLDHPFVPTLYARLDAGRYACFLMDYCSGGDLHAVLRRRPGGRLPVAAARFYAAEVLLAIEYLHALGFVYRDLKPENVLLRGDGHVVLSDFDLALPASVEPAVRLRQVRKQSRRRRIALLLSCFSGPSNGGGEDEEEIDGKERFEFVAEPTAASSKDCVGTHEYLAPELVSGSGHGNGVDWWAFGVFLYELVYGRTPFKGHTKEATLKNILSKQATYPQLDGEADASQLRDLVGRLLERDPRRRMGATRGAAEIKRHPFFSGVDWALIRCVAPPVVPDRDAAAPVGGGDRKAAKLGSWSSMSSNRGSKKRKSSSFGRRSTSTCEERQGVFRKLMSWNQESRSSNKIKTTTSKVK